MFPIVEPRQRPERFLLNRFSPLAESAAFLGLGGFDAAGSVWYPDARRLLGAVPNDGTLINMDPATDWVRSPELGRWGLDFGGYTSSNVVSHSGAVVTTGDITIAAWVLVRERSTADRLIDSGSFFVYLQSTTTWQVSSNNAVTTLTSGTTPGLAVLYHLAVTRAADGTAQFFINGNADTSGSSGSPGVVTKTYWGDNGAASRELNGRVYDPCIWDRLLSAGEISAIADPSNVMLEVGGVPLILPPHRVSFPAAVAEPSGFKPYWLRRSTQIIGGGVA